MNRQQKEAVVADLKKKFVNSQAAFLVVYKGLTVSKIQSLRKDLRALECGFKVAKARLMKIAVSDIKEANNFKEDFKDQVGLVFVKNEAPAVAKKLVAFSEENEVFRIVSAFFESRALSKNQIDYLASLPTKDVLLSQVMGCLQAPAGNFARLLNTMMVRLVFVLKQVSEKDGQQ